MSRHRAVLKLLNLFSSRQVAQSRNFTAKDAESHNYSREKGCPSTRVVGRLVQVRPYSSLTRTGMRMPGERKPRATQVDEELSEPLPLP